MSDAKVMAEKQPITLRQRIEIARRVGSHISLTPEQALSLVEAEESVARYENSRRIQAAENDRLRAKVAELEEKLTATERLAVRQANLLRRASR